MELMQIQGRDTKKSSKASMVYWVDNINKPIFARVPN
jgi:hypothetical protein